MPCFLYIILCDKKTFYIGVTNDLEDRLAQHKRKESFFTKKFSEIELVYYEEYSSKYVAEKRESQLKRWSVAKKKALISGDKALLRQLSKSS